MSDSADRVARILSDVAHDLRGLAGATDMWLELLDRATDAEGRARARSELRRAVAGSVRLADDLADAAAWLEGSGGRPATAFDLGEALAAAVQRAGATAQSRRVALALAPHEAPGHALTGDAEGWGRALDRVLLAALALTPPGTTLEVRQQRAGAGVEIVVPCPGAALPPDEPLLEAWGRARPPGQRFPLGLVLAAAFLAGAGARLAVRDEPAGRAFVVTAGPPGPRDTPAGARRASSR